MPKPGDRLAPDDLSGIHEGLGCLDRSFDGTPLARPASAHATDRRRPLASRPLGAHCLRWLAKHRAAQRVERTGAVRANYGQGQTAKYRKKKSKGLRRRKNERHKPQPQEPQAWITLLWHMGLRLPWTWRLGPSNSSERAHVMELLESGHFPKNTLFCGDAGFVGYPLWSLILSSGHDFLVRVGANVHLLWDVVDFRWAAGGAVLCWPQAALDAGLPPLRLRLVRVRLGREWMWMLTSVRDQRRLSNAQIVRLYKMRWGVEVEFRGLKQTLDRAKLRCRNSRRLMAELHWSILAMAVAELFALKEQLGACRATAGDPRQRSLAQTIRALRWCLTHLERAPESGQDLRSRLRRAVTDDYVRKGPKHARYRPRNPDKNPLGDPKVRPLNGRERRQLKLLQLEKSAA